jgi:hypothetical protein
MTENQIKEAISEAFIRLVLAHDGFKIYKAEYDHGVDLTVGPVDRFKLPNGDVILEDSDLRIDIQLKCTTKKNADFREKYLEYKLRFKNYRALKKKFNSKYIKMILIVFVLPEDRSKWMTVVEDSILLRKHCYWYIPYDDLIPPEILAKGKDSKVKIEIPLANNLLNNFRTIYKHINGL